MKAKRAVLLLALTVLLVGTSACTRVPRPAQISSDSIPEAVLRYVESRGSSIRNIVWHACYEQDGYLIVVNAHDVVSQSLGRSYREVEFVICKDTENGIEVLTTSAHRHTSAAYSWWPGTRPADSREEYMIFATGWAHAANAHQVAGTTANRGLLSEAPVVNGFWFLLVKDRPGTADVFDKVVVKDDQGNVTYSYPPSEY